MNLTKFKFKGKNQNAILQTMKKKSPKFNSLNSENSIQAKSPRFITGNTSKSNTVRSCGNN